HRRVRTKKTHRRVRTKKTIAGSGRRRPSPGPDEEDPSPGPDEEDPSGEVNDGTVRRVRRKKHDRSVTFRRRPACSPERGARAIAVGADGRTHGRAYAAPGLAWARRVGGQPRVVHATACAAARPGARPAGARPSPAA